MICIYTYREGHWRILGLFGGVSGVYPYTALFAPLEVLYGTRFGSKHHIMVQLDKLFWPSITDPVLDLWDHSRGPQNAILWVN